MHMYSAALAAKCGHLTGAVIARSIPLFSFLFFFAPPRARCRSGSTSTPAGGNKKN